jgi:hypothetical protein
VGAEDLDQDGRDGDGPGLVLGAVLQAAGLAGGAVVGPVAAGPGRGGGQVDAAPAAGGKMAVALAEHRFSAEIVTLIERLSTENNTYVKPEIMWI